MKLLRQTGMEWSSNAIKIMTLALFFVQVETGHLIIEIYNRARSVSIE